MCSGRKPTPTTRAGIRHRIGPTRSLGSLFSIRPVVDPTHSSALWIFGVLCSRISESKCLLSLMYGKDQPQRIRKLLFSALKTLTPRLKSDVTVSSRQCSITLLSFLVIGASRQGPCSDL